MDENIKIINKLKIDNPYATLWGNWYAGKFDTFHTINIWNGKRHLKYNLQSLGMAKKVCEDWADLLLNEKCYIVLPENANDDAFNRILDDNLFWVKANAGIEQSFALGFGSLVLSVENANVGDKGTILKSDDVRIKLDFVNRFHTKVISVENGQITEACFEFKNGETTTHIFHRLNENKEYVIYTYEKVAGKKPELINTFDTKSKVAWFQILRPNIASNFIVADQTIENFVSIFANSTDTLGNIDTKYDSFHNEFIAGRKRMMVSEEYVNVSNNQDNKPVSTFNPYDTTFLIAQNNYNEKQPFQDLAGVLRADEHIKALNTELNLLSNKVGMGEAYYRFDGAGVSTATQIVSENSKLFRTKKKHEILIEYALINLTIAINNITKTFTNIDLNIQDNDLVKIKVQFDDSIIEDKGTEMERDKGLVASGLMSVIEFREKYMAEDLETATLNYRKYFKADIINKYLPALTQGGITVADYVMEVYGEENQDLINEITERLKTSDSYGDLIGDLYDDTE